MCEKGESDGRTEEGDLRIKIGDGTPLEVFSAVAGIGAKTIALPAGLVASTTADSPGAWREKISGAGASKAEAAGSGVFKDAASDERMRAV
jgi:TP901-1 family phage major tail protein